MRLTSPAFENNQKIPKQFTCQGQGFLPELNISDIPENTKSLAIILKDPDSPSGTFIHWLAWNISPDISIISENTYPEGSIQGQNSVGQNRYMAPCPPSGPHRYIFALFALDTTLTLPPEATSKELEETIKGHILGETTLTGIFP